MYPTGPGGQAHGNIAEWVRLIEERQQTQLLPFRSWRLARTGRRSGDRVRRLPGRILTLGLATFEQLWGCRSQLYPPGQPGAVERRQVPIDTILYPALLRLGKMQAETVVVHHLAQAWCG